MVIREFSVLLGTADVGANEGIVRMILEKDKNQPIILSKVRARPQRQLLNPPL